MSLLKSLDAAGGNGPGTAFEIAEGLSKCILIFEGPATSGTATLEVSPDDETTWITTGLTITNLSPYAAGVGQGGLAIGGTHIRLSLTGWTSGVVNAYIAVE